MARDMRRCFTRATVFPIHRDAGGMEAVVADFPFQPRRFRPPLQGELVG